jgi:hypothetical protein
MCGEREEGMAGRFKTIIRDAPHLGASFVNLAHFRNAAKSKMLENFNYHILRNIKIVNDHKPLNSDVNTFSYKFFVGDICKSHNHFTET